MRHIIYFIILITVFTSCDEYGYQLEYDCSYDFPILVNSQIDTIQKNQLRNYYYVFHDSLDNTDTVYWDSAFIAVDMYVDEIEGKNNYMLVSQKPFYKIIYETDENNKGARSNFNNVRDIVKHSEYYEYWIIITNTNDIYGPFSIIKYKEYREKLRVPDELRLNFEKTTFDKVLFSVQNILTYILLFLFYTIILLLAIAICVAPIILIGRYIKNKMDSLL